MTNEQTLKHWGEPKEKKKILGEDQSAIPNPCNEIGLSGRSECILHEEYQKIGDLKMTNEQISERLAALLTAKLQKRFKAVSLKDGYEYHNVLFDGAGGVHILPDLDDIPTPINKEDFKILQFTGMYDFTTWEELTDDQRRMHGYTGINEENYPGEEIWEDDIVEFETVNTTPITIDFKENPKEIEKYLGRSLRYEIGEKETYSIYYNLLFGIRFGFAEEIGPPLSEASEKIINFISKKHSLTEDLLSGMKIFRKVGTKYARKIKNDSI